MEVSWLKHWGGLSFKGIIDVKPLSCHQALSLARQINLAVRDLRTTTLLPG